MEIPRSLLTLEAYHQEINRIIADPSQEYNDILPWRKLQWRKDIGFMRSEKHLPTGF